ncbi:response regulator receiver domain [Pseudomonadota bacterium]
MALEFSKRSLEVSQDFLQTAVIIDDHAYYKSSVSTPAVALMPGRGGQVTREIKKTPSNEEGHLNTSVLIRSFADHGIICSALEFTDFSANSISFKKTAKSADIVIIDWEMEDEKSGENALKLISSLLEDDFSNPQRFRLATIYTAAVDLEGISQKVAAHIQQAHDKKLSIDQNGLRLVYQSIVITIHAKDPHGIPDHLQFNVADESELPKRLVACFSENISGILPNTALSALTAIRHSTHRILALFNRNLDFAYLTHRASLPKPEDAASHLEVLIAEEIKSILSSYDCIGSNASFPEIKKWILEKYKKGHQFTCPDGTLNRDAIINCIKIGNSKNQIQITGGKNKLYQKFSHLLSGDADISSTCDLDLSRLSVLKTRYKNSAPYLTSGVILQQQTDKSLWICIQPKCDSVRLENKSRRFPLLPILSGIGGELTLPRLRDEDVGKFCHILIHPQNCRSVEFKSALANQSQIYPRRIKEKWIYLSTEKLRFQFIAELKDEIAQNVLNDFAATTARVGINPSEWLRKSGLDK